MNSSQSARKASLTRTPWHGLASALERSLELQTADRGLQQLVQDSPEGLERLIRVRSRLLPIGAGLIERAQAAGAVHPDVSPADIPIVQLMVGSVIDAGRDTEPELWRRYLGLVLRGIAARPEDLPPLPGEPPPPDSCRPVAEQGSAALRLIGVADGAARRRPLAQDLGLRPLGTPRR